MDTAVNFPNVPGSKTTQDSVPALALASAVVTAAAGSLLGFSFLPGGKRRVSNTTRLGLSVLVACAGIVLWAKREEEAEAARHLLHYIGDKRDERWLRHNPIDFG